MIVEMTRWEAALWRAQQELIQRQRRCRALVDRISSLEHRVNRIESRLSL